MHKSTLRALQLTEQQRATLESYERKEDALKEALKRAGINSSAAKHITAAADLEKVNAEDVDALTEQVKIQWAEFLPDKDRDKVKINTNGKTEKITIDEARKRGFNI